MTNRKITKPFKAQNGIIIAIIVLFLLIPWGATGFRGLRTISPSRDGDRMPDSVAYARVLGMQLASKMATTGSCGQPGTYTWEKGIPSNPDFLPEFTAPKNDLAFSVTIGPSGKTYEIAVRDPKTGSIFLFDEMGRGRTIDNR